MNPINLEYSLNFQYQKTAKEIIEKIKAKIIVVQAKIEERQKRIADLRKEYEIDDAALIQLLTEARRQLKRTDSDKGSYSYNTRRTDSQGVEEKVIGIGAVNNLLSESDAIDAEKAQVKRMELIARNLKPIPHFADNGAELAEVGFDITMGELEYLGF